MNEHRIQWFKSIRAVFCLVARPSETSHAFDIMRAFDPCMMFRTLHRFKADPRGANLLEREVSLLDAVTDQEALRRMAEDSLGYRYHQFLHDNQIDPSALLALWKRRGEYPSDDEAAWFLDRHVLTHDLIHVICGWDTHAADETCQIWFSFGQEGGRANLLIASLGTLRFPWKVATFWRAYRLGRHAEWIITLPLENLLTEPLDRARRRCGVIAHLPDFTDLGQTADPI